MSKVLLKYESVATKALVHKATITVLRASNGSGPWAKRMSQIGITSVTIYVLFLIMIAILDLDVFIAHILNITLPIVALNGFLALFVYFYIRSNAVALLGGIGSSTKVQFDNTGVRIETPAVTQEISYKNMKSIKTYGDIIIVLLGDSKKMALVFQKRKDVLKLLQSKIID